MPMIINKSELIIHYIATIRSSLKGVKIAPKHRTIHTVQENILDWTDRLSSKENK